MRRNLSNTERLIRAALGVAILLLGFIGPRTVWALVGVIPLLTAIVGFDPFYRMAGIDTRHKRA